MPTHPVDMQLLEQHCYKSAAGLLLVACAFLRVYNA
jgi:hypothetical protein